jgi:hypothetical protein
METGIAVLSFGFGFGIGNKLERKLRNLEGEDTRSYKSRWMSVQCYRLLLIGMILFALDRLDKINDLDYGLQTILVGNYLVGLGTIPGIHFFIGFHRFYQIRKYKKLPK